MSCYLFYTKDILTAYVNLDHGENVHMYVSAPDKARVQAICDHTTTLHEIDIPCLIEGGDFEASVPLDDLVEVMKHYTVMKITEDTIVFDGCTESKYKHGDVISWSTRLPHISLVIKVEKSLIGHIDEYQGLTLEYNHNSKKFSATSGEFGIDIPIVASFCKEPCDEPIEKIKLDPEILLKYLKKYNNKFMKIYFEKDFPLCVEDVSRAPQRHYIAPYE